MFGRRSGSSATSVTPTPARTASVSRPMARSVDSASASRSTSVSIRDVRSGRPTPISGTRRGCTRRPSVGMTRRPCGTETSISRGGVCTSSWRNPAAAWLSTAPVPAQSSAAWARLRQPIGPEWISSTTRWSRCHDPDRTRRSIVDAGTPRSRHCAVVTTPSCVAARTRRAPISTCSASVHRGAALPEARSVCGRIRKMIAGDGPRALSSGTRGCVWGCVWGWGGLASVCGAKPHQWC